MIQKYEPNSTFTKASSPNVCVCVGLFCFVFLLVVLVKIPAVEEGDRCLPFSPWALPSWQTQDRAGLAQGGRVSTAAPPPATQKTHPTPGSI